MILHCWPYIVDIQRKRFRTLLNLHFQQLILQPKNNSHPFFCVCSQTVIVPVQLFVVSMERHFHLNVMLMMFIFWWIMLVAVIQHQDQVSSNYVSCELYFLLFFSSSRQNVLWWCGMPSFVVSQLPICHSLGILLSPLWYVTLLAFNSMHILHT